MAFSIYTQSNIAQKWVNFISDSLKYFDKIEKIVNKDSITSIDKKRVKIMLEIIINEYKLLPKSKLLPEYLKKQADNSYKKAKEIYEKVFNK